MSYDPTDHSADEVREYLHGEDDTVERDRVLLLERQNKNRSTVLREFGVDPDERVDDTGRVLYAWEVDADEQVLPGKPDADFAPPTEDEILDQVESDNREADLQPAEDAPDTGVPEGSPVAGSEDAPVTV